MNMNKIYSRPRIKLPKFYFREFNFKENKNNNDNKINRNKGKITLVIFIAIFTAKIVLDAVYPIFDTLCESKAKSIATIISNEEATNVMKDYSYDELFTVEKDANNNITMIKSNMKAINEITSSIAVRIQNRINDTERENIEIALRKFYWI